MVPAYALVSVVLALIARARTSSLDMPSGVFGVSRSQIESYVASKRQQLAQSAVIEASAALIAAEGGVEAALPPGGGGMTAGEGQAARAGAMMTRHGYSRPATASATARSEKTQVVEPREEEEIVRYAYPHGRD
jgi:hypothetical protein